MRNDSPAATHRAHYQAVKSGLPVLISTIEEAAVLPLGVCGDQPMSLAERRASRVYRATDFISVSCVSTEAVDRGAGGF